MPEMRWGPPPEKFAKKLGEPNPGDEAHYALGRMLNADADELNRLRREVVGHRIISIISIAMMCGALGFMFWVAGRH